MLRLMKWGVLCVLLGLQSADLFAFQAQPVRMGTGTMTFDTVPG